MSSITGTALIKLPSGVKKIFSTFATGSLGNVSLAETKKCKVNKAGFYKNLGKKSIVRGIAKNPIDHPHGGRTKAIKYQRTP
jgi:large subunit ribosomal protein L2